MTRTKLTRWATAAAVSALLGAAVVAMTPTGASALVAPPGNSSIKACRAIGAGYTGIGTYPNYGGGLVYAGKVTINLCVHKDGVTGKRFASEQITAPTTYGHKWFTGGLTVKLQQCLTTSSFITLQTGTRNFDSTYDYAYSSGGKWIFSTNYTPSANAASPGLGHRVLLTVVAGVVIDPAAAGFDYILAPSGYNGTTSYATPCLVT